MRIFLVSLGIGMCVLSLNCKETGLKEAGSKMANTETLFQRYCVNCHGSDGSLQTNGARDLRYSSMSLEERILVITEGRNIMTGFKSILDEVQIKDLAQFTISLNQTAPNGQ